MERSFRRGRSAVCALFLATMALLPAHEARALADSGTDELWITRYSGPGRHTDAATGMAVSPDGSTIS